MSRCYPFPPPGYAENYSSREALILSIKLQNEREKAISVREGDKEGRNKDTKDKHRNKEKKNKEERRKEKKDKEEGKKEKREKKGRKAVGATAASVEIGKKVVAHKLSKADNVVVESGGKLVALLERSSLTEEHGRPIDSQYGACSSDSTSNSNKRRRYSPSPIGIQSSGNKIRIRLSTIQKRDEPSTSGSKQQAGLLPPRRDDFVTSHSQAEPSIACARPELSIKQKHVIPAIKQKDVIRNDFVTAHSQAQPCIARARPELSIKQNDVLPAIKQKDVLPAIKQKNVIPAIKQKDVVLADFVTSHTQARPCIARASPELSVKQKDVISDGLSRAALTSTVARAAPTRTVARAAPTRTLARAAPTSTLARAAPTSTLARAAPTSTLARAAPTSTLARAAPTSTLARAEPTSTVARAEPTSTVTVQVIPTKVSSLKEPTSESVSQKERLSSHGKIQCRDIHEELSSIGKRMQKKKSLYNSLFRDWVPPPLESVVDYNDDDEDWLFGRKNEDRAAKRLRVGDEIGSCGGENLACSASAVMQPQAHFLADVQLYALPYTVPF